MQNPQSWTFKHSTTEFWGFWHYKSGWTSKWKVNTFITLEPIWWITHGQQISSFYSQIVITWVCVFLRNLLRQIGEVLKCTPTQHNIVCTNALTHTHTHMHANIYWDHTATQTTLFCWVYIYSLITLWAVVINHWSSNQSTTTERVINHLQHNATSACSFSSSSSFSVPNMGHISVTHFH